MTDRPLVARPKRAFIRIPPNWKDMTEEEQRAASLDIARALQRQLLPRSPEPPKAREGGGEAAAPMRPRETAKGGPRPP